MLLCAQTSIMYMLVCADKYNVDVYVHVYVVYVDVCAEM